MLIPLCILSTLFFLKCLEECLEIVGIDKLILLFFFFLFFKDLFVFIYDRRERVREAETQAEGEAGSMQGARCGTPSGTPGSRPEPKTDAYLLSHPGVPPEDFLLYCSFSKK